MSLPKAKYTLKFKILSGICFMLIACTGFNLYYSNQLFLQDKTSYLYEAGLKRVLSINDQLKSKLNENQSRSMFYFLLAESNPEGVELLIRNQADLVLAGKGVFSAAEFTTSFTSKNTLANQRMVNDYKISEQIILDEVKLKLAEKKESAASISWVKNYHGHNFAFSVYRPAGLENFFFSVEDVTSFFNQIISDDIYQNKIILLDDKKIQTENSKWLYQITNNLGQNRTLSLQIDGSEFLLSYTSNIENILVTSMISKDEVFAVTKTLLSKTLFFALFLLGIAIIFGIFFSSSITHPINLLEAKALKIAEGDLSGEVQITSSDELSVLGHTFNWMSEEINKLLQTKMEMILKLEDYNKNLEHKVAERTLDLKKSNDFMSLMMNSLGQGLLVFDRNLQCQKLYTRVCESIFNTSPEHKNLAEVLSLDEKEMMDFYKWGDLTFQELLPFESMIALTLQEKKYGTDFKDPNFKSVKLEYYPMRDEEEKLKNILLVATDQSALVVQAQETKEQEQYVSMILKVLNNKIQFQSFINEVFEILSRLEHMVKDTANEVDLASGMIHFHTLNGGFGLYSLFSLQQLARGFESEINEKKALNAKNITYLEIITRGEAQIRAELNNTLMELNQKVGTKFGMGDDITEISKEKILQLEKLVAATNNLQLIEYFADNFIKVPIITYFKAYSDMCVSFAANINKKFKGIVFTNEKLMIRADDFLDLFNNLVHLFRNCIDHGIETPETRSNTGKPPEGMIHVLFSTVKDNISKEFLVIEVRDDGGGISPDKIREKYLKLNPDISLSHLSDAQVLYKIFDPFFSTKEEVTTLSGRGVGMSAIKEALDKLGGKIIVQSVPKKGTRFILTVPIRGLV